MNNERPDPRERRLREGFTLPPLPGAEAPSAEDYPTDVDTLALVASGTMVSAAVLFGLKSFQGTGHLYGALGRMLQDPDLTLQSLMLYGKRIMESGDPGTLASARAALADRAMKLGDPHAQADRADEAIKAARQIREQRARWKAGTKATIAARITGVIHEASNQFKDVVSLEEFQAEMKTRFDKYLDPNSRYWSNRVYKHLNQENYTDFKLAKLLLHEKRRELGGRQFNAFLQQNPELNRVWTNQQASVDRSYLDSMLRGQQAQPHSANVRAIEQLGGRRAITLHMAARISTHDALEHTKFGRALKAVGQAKTAYNPLRTPNPFFKEESAFVQARLRGDQIPQTDLGIVEAWASFVERNPYMSVPEGMLPGEVSKEQLRKLSQIDSEFRRHLKQHQRGLLATAKSPLESRVHKPQNLGITQIFGARPQEPHNLVNPYKVHAEIAERMRSAIDQITVKGFAGPGVKTSQLFYHDPSAAGRNYGTGGPAFSKASFKQSPGLVDDLAIHLQDGFAKLKGRLEKGGESPMNFDIRKIHTGDGHQAYELTYSRPNSTHQAKVRIPLPDQSGMMKLGDQARPVAGKLTLLFENDLFNTDPAYQILNKHRIRPVVNPAELAIIRIGSFFQRQGADISGTQNPDQLAGFIQRIVNDTMNETTIAGMSLLDNLNKATQIQSQASVVLKNYMENPRVRNRLNTGMQSISRLKRVFDTGRRYFAVDSEFTSSDILREVGIKPGKELAAGRIPYEIGGSILEARGGTPVEIASIKYMPQLFTDRMSHLTDIQKTHMAQVKEQITEFQKTHAGKTSAEIKQLLNKLHKGHLSIRYQGTEYFLNGNIMADSRGKTLGFLPKKETGETLERYYLRVQNAILTETKTQFSIGHNYLSSELPIFNRLYNAHSDQYIHPALMEKNAIDTLPMAHVLSPNQIGSKALANVTAALYGFTEPDYMDALEKVRDILRNKGGEQRAAAIKALIPRYDEADKTTMGHRADQRRRFFNALANEVNNLPSDFNLHTANLDAFLTGRFAAAEMRRLMDTASGEAIVDMMGAIVSRHRLGHQLDFADIYGGIGFSDTAEPGTAFRFFVNQESAAWGEGSLLDPRLLPFFQLQQPVRQLYQRLKPRLLLNPIRDRGTQELYEGLALAPRFKDPTAQATQVFGDVPTIPFFDPATRKVIEVPSAIHGGHGSVTTRMLAAYGGWDGVESTSLETYAAYLPGNHRYVYGSKGMATARFREAASSAIEAAVHSERANIQSLTEGMNDWVQRKSMQVQLLFERHGGSLNSLDIDMADSILKQNYMLQRLLDTQDVALSKDLKEIIAKTMARNRDRLFGKTYSEKDILLEAYDELRRNAPDSPVIGSRKELYSPTASNLKSHLMGEWRGPNSPNALGLEIKIRDLGDKSGRLEITYIKDPGDVYKMYVANQAKVGIFGTSTLHQVGRLGESLVVEAAFDKAKRGEFAGYLQAHVDRVRRRVQLEIGSLIRQNVTGPEFHKRREEALQRAARAFSKLTGGKMSEGQVRNQMVVAVHADRVKVELTDQFITLAQEAPLRNIAAASQEAGITLEANIQEMVHGSRGEASRRSLIQLYRDGLSGQGNTPGLIQNIDNTIAEMTAKATSSKSADRQLWWDRIAEAKDTRDRLQRQVAELDRMLISGNLTNGAVLQEGAFWDFHMNVDDKQISLAYQVLAGAEHMQTDPTAGTTAQDRFHRLTGRATKAKQQSVLTSTLMGHAAAYSHSGLQPRSSSLFSSWLAASSGMAAFSDDKFRGDLTREVSHLAQKYNIDLKEHAIESFIEWDPEQKRLFFVNPQNPSLRTALQVNPFTTLTDHVKQRVGLLSMIRGEMIKDVVSGMPVGDPSRIMDVVYDGTKGLNKKVVSARDLISRFGREARAKMHYQFEKGMDLKDIPDKIIRSFDTRSIYLGEGSPLGTTPRDVPFFNTSKFDFVRVRLNQGISDSQIIDTVNTLKSLGFDDVANELFGDNVEEALIRRHGGVVTDAERRRVQTMLNMIRRDGPSTPFPREILLPTQAVETEEVRAGFKKASLGRGAEFIDNLEGIAEIETAAKRIKDLAMRYRDGRISPEVFAREMEAVRTPLLRESLAQRQELFNVSIAHLLSRVTAAAEDLTGTYLTGRYKLAATQMDMTHDLQRIARTIQDAGGPGKGYKQVKEVVRGMLGKSNFLAMTNEADFNRRVEQASRSLFAYASRQMRQHGGGADDIYKWAGFGANEGFVATSQVDIALKKARSRAAGYRIGVGIDGIKEHFKNLQIDDLDQRASAELRILERAALGTGEGSVITMDARQPDFTQILGYEMQAKTAIHDEALRALGMDPHRVHLSSTPLSSWSRLEDFDFDLNYMSIINDPIVSGQLRRTKVKDMGHQMAMMYSVLHASTGGAMEMEGLYGLERYGDRWIYRPGRENLIGDTTTASKFATEGGAMRAATRGRDARMSYGLQKAVVGEFGGYAKRGAIKTMNFENAFMDMMGGLVELTEKPGNEAKLRRIFRGSNFQAQSLGFQSTAWDFMKETFVQASRDQAQYGPDTLVSPLHRTQLAIAQITQEVAIEKYKGEGALRTAREMQQIMRGLLGQDGQYKTFDQAFDALMKSETKLKAWQFFAEEGDMQQIRENEGRISARLEQQLRDRARKAFKLRHDQAVSGGMLATLLSDDYHAFAANMSKSDLPIDTQLAMADINMLFRETHGVSGAVDRAAMAEDAVVFKEVRARLDDTARFARSLSVLAEEHSLDAFQGRMGIRDRMLRTFQDMSPGGRAATVAMGAAAAIIAVSGPAFGPVDGRVDPHRYDTPWTDREESVRPRRGSPQTTRRAAEAMVRQRQQAAYGMVPASPQGRQHQVRRPPTIRASY